MNIQENIDLKKHSTMRLGGQARWLAEASADKDVQDLVLWAQEKNIPLLMIGQGSNIIWREEGFDGLVIVNRILGREIMSEDSNSAIVQVGGGEVWDDVVGWTVETGLSGIEFLSLIPGTAGAAPIQNIGAYGKEIASVLKEVGTYDIKNGSFDTVLASDCGFSYRNSRFKTADRDRFLVTSITMQLAKTNPAPPFYESLQNYLKEHDINNFTPAIIRDAIVDIRRSKLPDPVRVANNGSFFINPIIEQAKFEKICQKYPDAISWPANSGQVRMSAGWMIEKAGFAKGYHDQQTGMGTWQNSALIMINERAGHTADLLVFKQKIINGVKAEFDIDLVQEPLLLP
jgi:UDP-N-acetylmuramate dehydrogenase